jgi:peptide/nickel transport system ATP-binding protein
MRLGSQRAIRAVDDVSLLVHAGSVLALVGESGSGKSTLGRLLAQLYRPTSGEVLLKGQPARVSSTRALRRYVKSVQLILQDPYASLNPHHTVGYHIARPLRIHQSVTRDTPKREARAQAVELLESVDLIPGIRFYEKFPHELSGGQRQRVAIARALAAKPDVLIADEPVSMLDVSVRLGILDLLEHQRSKGAAIVYITHDLPSAYYFADKIAVMYAGELVEYGAADEVVTNPAHPYTQLLLAATPDPSRDRRSRTGARGEPPSLIDIPSGCRFHPRCPYVFDRCRKSAPDLTQVSPNHLSKCWLHTTDSRSQNSHRLRASQPVNRRKENL